MEELQLVGANVLGNWWEICTEFVVLSVNADDAKLKIFGKKNRISIYFSIFFQSSCSNPVLSVLQILANFQRMPYTAINVHLALLAHVASQNMRTVSDTFRRRTVPPSGTWRRSEAATCQVRSPCHLRQPAETGQAPQYSVLGLCYSDNLSGVCSTYLAVCLRMWRAGFFALRATGRSEYTNHLWCRCVTLLQQLKFMSNISKFGCTDKIIILNLKINNTVKQSELKLLWSDMNRWRIYLKLRESK
jgi:hypothetical protein